MASLNPRKWFRDNPKDEDRQKTSGFNELINSSGNDDEQVKHPKTSGFNEALNQSNELAPENQLQPQQVAQPGAPPDDSYDQGLNSGLNRAGQPKQSERGAQAAQASSPSDEAAKKAEKADEDKAGTKPPAEAGKGTEAAKDKDHKPAKESDKTAGGGEKPTKTGKKAEGETGKSSKSAKSAGRSKLTNRFGGLGKFASTRRNEIAIGAGVMGIFVGGLLLIASVAPLKVVDMMENIYSHRFHRVSHAYNTRKNKIIKKYFGDWFCGHKTAANTCEKFVDNAVVDDARKGFFENISTNMRHSDFNDNLAKSGYKLEITSTNNLNIYKNGELVSNYDLLTQKADARHDVNLIYEEVSKSEGWFKRWRSKRWFQKISGTKWHWLDPIKQPIAQVKKKVISDVVDYLLENKLTGEIANKIVLAIIGQETTTELGANAAGSEVVSGAAPILAEDVAAAPAETVLAEGGVKTLTTAAVDKSAASLGSQFATAIADSSNPIGWAIAVIQIGCGVLNVAHDQTIQHILAEYAQLQYVTMFTKYQSISSQVKEGNRDKKMGDDELSANTELLSSADGKQDVATSNNYQRAIGNPVPYNINSDDVTKCESGRELCHERQPNNVLESTLFGKALLSGLAALDPDTRKQLFGEDAGGKWNPLDPGSIYNQAVCKAVGGITNALQWLIGKAFDAFKAGIEKCAGTPLGDQIVIPLPGGPPLTCNQWKETLDNGTKIAATVFKWINEHIVVPLLNLVIANSVRGPDLVSAVSAGAEYAADSQLKDLNADPLSQDQLNEDNHRYYAELQQKHQDASLADKMFSLDDNYSLASRLLHGTPSSGKAFTGQAIAFVSSYINPANAVKNIYSGSGTLAKVGSRQAIADQPTTATEKDGSVVNEFGMRVQNNNLGEVYGFSEKDLNDEPLGSDKMQKLDEQAACSMIANVGVKDEDKPQECRDNESNGSTGGGPGEVISGNGDFIWPLKPKGTLSQCYGNNGHPGLDIGAPLGTPVFASHEGTVVQAHDGAVAGDTTANGGAGNYVSIDHGNNIFTRYLHFKTGSVKVKNGDHVDKGQQIGEVDNTGYSKGDHLHIEYRTGGEFGGSSQTHNFLAFTKDTEGVGNLSLCPTTDTP